MLPHERLEIYWLTEEYVAFIQYMMPRIRARSRHDADQLDREAGSMLLNLIEGTAETSPPDKVRFLRYYRREVNESYGVFRKQHLSGAITHAELRIANYYADRLSGTAWRIMKRWGG